MWFRRIDAFLVIAVLGLAAAPSVTLAADSDLETVQGDWSAKMESPDGEHDATMSVNKKKLRFNGPEPLGWMEATFELDWNAKPKRMSMVIEDCEVKELKGLSVEAIYTIDGKTWTICATAPGSPTGPSGFDDPKARTVEFKRIKSSGRDKIRSRRRGTAR